MPIYEYQCQNCGYLFEELQTMSEAPLVTCPNCGKDELKKLIGSGGGIIFKGSGFYQTDYKKSAEPAENKTGKSEEKAQEKSVEKSQEISGEKSQEKSEEKSGNKPTEKPSEKTDSKAAKPETKTETSSKPKTEVKKDSGSSEKSQKKK